MASSELDAILGRLVHTPPSPAPSASLEAFRTQHRAAVSGLERPIARAMVGGYVADRPAWAFAAGYQEALRHLRPSSGDATLALAATEEGGNHPRAIRSRLAPDGSALRLSGSKRFVTLGPLVEKILVVARRGVGADGRPQLVVVEVPRDREGVEVTSMPELPFVPELPHGALELRDVRVLPREVDAGDGYLGLLKPFRTVEDLFVAAALGAYALQVARRGGCDAGFVAAQLALLSTLHALSDTDPLAPSTHLALEGALRTLHAQLDAVPLDSLAPEVRARLERDRALLSVARSARERRFEAALRDLA